MLRCTRLVFSIIKSVTDMHTLWRKKTFLSKSKVACGDHHIQTAWCVMPPRELEADFLAPLDRGAQRVVC